ncbi:protein spinster homolog 3 [Dasypus novemcinctus]|uniref:protein spinster homolog 3 n=1 Tax=Dasypus novemcinctus TaxID=9361 RepID=UPI00266026D9|nr:protein spinster homolog 3 [Dasypus novemcinctus]
MSVEGAEPGPEGPHGGSPGPGRRYGALAAHQGPAPTTPAPWSLPRWRAYVAAAVLCYINLLNYMNWFIIAAATASAAAQQELGGAAESWLCRAGAGCPQAGGADGRPPWNPSLQGSLCACSSRVLLAQIEGAWVLLDVQKFFHISDSNAGLLQTVFIGCLLLSAPVFGYLGDRHSRKATLSFGILLWSGAGLSSSFISPRYSWLFFLSRGVVGTGTASYSTIAPTVLGDLFVKDQRTRMLAIFYIFIPVGSGLGYILGSVVTELTGNWRWALRIMPCLEAVALILLILLVPDPPRGAAEKQGEMALGDARSSWCEDVRYLGRNWSFVWSTLGVTAMAFVTGALGFWAPKFLFEARVVHGLQLPCFQEPCNSQDSLIFGALTVATGITGVILGAEASRRYKKVNPRAEPLICASSLLATAPCLYLALILAPTTLLASYVFLALGELLLSCNWAVVADILLSVVVPRRRGTAEALQITLGHVLGDAGSPYLTGLIASTLRAGRPNSYLQRFLSLQQSFLCCVFAIALGGGCFLLTALHLERDQAQVQASGASPSEPSLGGGTLDHKDAESHNLLSGTGASTQDP